ncbi:MAG: cyclic nucleotide-binding domain-containing protein [Candidatus Flexifilum sp.]|jgi:CRP-like cAMP-binding protein
MISPELLRRFKLFAGLPPEALAEIAQFCEEEALEADTYLFEQGDEADELYLVLDGAVDLLMDIDSKGESRTEIETVVAGEALGWSALVEPHEYQLSAAAATEVKVILIDAPRLRDYLAAHPDHGYVLMRRVAQMIGERLGHMRTRFISLVE